MCSQMRENNFTLYTFLTCGEPVVVNQIQFESETRDIGGHRQCLYTLVLNQSKRGKYDTNAALQVYMISQQETNYEAQV